MTECTKIQYNHLPAVHGFVDDLEDEVSPNDMKHQKDGQKTIEDVISREHFHNLWSLNCRTIKNPGGINTQTGDDPSQSKTGKK